MINILLIAIGSALGGVFRYSLNYAILLVSPGFVSLATLLVNVSGSFLVGYLVGLWASDAKVTKQHYKWHFGITGVCGGYTTFSAFSWQLLELIKRGNPQIAGLYAAASIGLSLLAVWVGITIASRGTSDLEV